MIEQNSTDEDLLFEIVKVSPFIGELPEPAKSFKLSNPLCGDEVTFYSQLTTDGKIEAIKFETQGCFICRASAAVVAELAAGKNGEEVALELDDFRKKFVDHPDSKWESVAMQQLFELRQYPTRAKCVLMPFEVLKKLLTDLATR